MPTYIVLNHFTEQGIRSVKDTTKRADALGEMAKKVGATVKDAYWTIGRYELVGHYRRAERRSDDRARNEYR